MKRLLKLVMIALLCAPRGMWAMKEEEIVIHEEPVRKQIKHTPTKKVTSQKIKEEPLAPTTNVTQYFITFNKAKFPVSLKVLNQFEVYKAQLKNIAKYGDKNITITEHPSKKYAKGTEDIGRPKTTKQPLMVVWDITPFIEQLFDIKGEKEKAYAELSEKYGIELTELIHLMIDITTGKKNANSIESKEELFLVIKIADFLGNKTILQRCNTTLMDKLMGEHQLENFVRTLTAPQNDKYANLWCVTTIPGTPFVVSGFDDTLMIWNYKTGQFVGTLTAPQGDKHTRPVTCVVYIPGTNYIVSGSDDKTIKIWDYTTKLFVETLTAPQNDKHKSWVSSVVHIPGTNYIASGSHDKTIKIWDYETGLFVKTLTAPQNNMHIDWVNSLVYIPGTNYIVSGSDDKTIKVWDFITGLFVKTLTAPQGHEHTDEVTSLVYIPGTNYIVSGSKNGTIKVWDFITGLFVKTLTAPQDRKHIDEVTSLVYIPGTNYIVSGSKDKTIKVWDFITGLFVKTLTAPQESVHTDWVSCMTTIPGTPFIVSSSSDNTLKVWTLNPAADFTFQQIELCWNIFTSEKPLELSEGSYDHETFLSLPDTLQKQIIKLKKVKVTPALRSTLVRSSAPAQKTEETKEVKEKK